MKRLHTFLTLISILVLLITPVNVVAASADQPEIVTYSSPVIITEIQTGAGTASDEFIELYNASPQPVDITGWQVRYINASTTTTNATLLATIQNQSEQPVILPAQSYFVLHSTSVNLAEGILGQSYTAKLSSSDKSVLLFRQNLQVCALEVADAVGWGTSNTGEGAPLSIGTLSNGERLVTRLRLTNGQYVDTQNNNSDLKLANSVKNSSNPTVSSGATPGSDNAHLYTGALPQEGQNSTLESINISGCTIPEDIPIDNGLEDPIESDVPPAVIEPAQEEQEGSASNNSGASKPVMPARDIGLKSPQLTELLPNPGKPQTDANDEFVELYNANDSAFELSGFKLSNGKKQYTFPAGSLIQPKSFKAYFSADTKLTLSNTQGQVQLLDPFGNVIGHSDVYGAAKENQSWALVGSAWNWTTAPTPNAANVIKAPVPKKKKTTTTSARVKASSAKTAGALYTPKNVSANAESKSFDEVLRNPLHPGVLALVGAFALLYGAYEYRAGVANKIHQFRVYRETRRENRRKS